MLERLFQLQAHGTTVRKEVVAGITTFLTMAYIIVVNPSILSSTGMDFGAVFVATCLAAVIGTLIMGLWANYPIALAPGMGLNAFFSFTVVGSMGYSWQVALGAVFLSGFLFFLLSIFKVREWIINSIPMSLRFGISAGIGFFLALIALKNAGIVVDHPSSPKRASSIGKPNGNIGHLKSERRPQAGRQEQDTRSSRDPARWERISPCYSAIPSSITTNIYPFSAIPKAA